MAESTSAAAGKVFTREHFAERTETAKQLLWVWWRDGGQPDRLGVSNANQAWDALSEAGRLPWLAVAQAAESILLERAAQVADRFAAQAGDNFEISAAMDIGAGIRALVTKETARG